MPDKEVEKSGEVKYNTTYEENKKAPVLPTGKTGAFGGARNLRLSHQRDSVVAKVRPTLCKSV